MLYLLKPVVNAFYGFVTICLIMAAATNSISASMMLIAAIAGFFCGLMYLAAMWVIFDGNYKPEVFPLTCVCAGGILARFMEHRVGFLTPAPEAIAPFIGYTANVAMMAVIVLGALMLLRELSQKEDNLERLKRHIADRYPHF